MKDKSRSATYSKTMVAAAVAGVVAAHSPVSVLAQEMEEIMVTATRRAESVQDVPYNITAISGESLNEAGIGNLADLMKAVPGAVHADMGARANSQNSTIVLRGLNAQALVNSSAFANLTVPSVSTYMDETPVFMNLQLLDVNRVEVLRGPQGTLYGSGSLAGTIRFIHNEPDLEATSGAVQASIRSDDGAGDLSYGLRGTVNIPMSDNFGVRFSGGYDNTAGLIDVTGLAVRDSAGIPVLDDPSDVINSPYATTDISDHDTSESWSVRFAALWDISESVEAKLTWHHQTIDAEGNAFRDMGGDAYSLEYASVDEFEQDVDVLSLEIEADLGFATLVSSTSQSESDIETTRDLSFLVESLDADIGPCYIYGCYPRGVFTGSEPAKRKDVTQELRLVSNSEGSVDWMIGGFYNDQDADLILAQTVYGYADWANTPGSDAAVAGTIGIPGGLGLSFYDFWLAGAIANPADEDYQFFNQRNVQFTDKAIYGELTFHATDQWQITFGARAFDQDYKHNLRQEFTNCGIFCSPSGSVRGVDNWATANSFDDQIFKVNTSYEINDSTNVYVTWSEGFRHGGSNALPVGAFGIVQEDIPFESDESQNIEVGVKGSFGESGMNYTAAYYQIDWKNPQLDMFLTAAALPAVKNGDEAESKGLELAIDGNLTENLYVMFGYNYTDAQITKDFVAGSIAGFAGERLPGIAEHQANLTLSYIKPLSNGWDVSYRLDGVYMGDRKNDLSTGGAAFDLPSYSLFNGSVGVLTDNWTVTAHLRNMLNEKNAIFTATNARSAVSAARPISFGITASYNF